MIPVRATDRAFSAAVAELPRSARQVRSARGSVCIVPWHELDRAIDEGALALVVTGGDPLPDELDRADEAARALPVVLHRPTAPAGPQVVDDVSVIAIEVQGPRATAAEDLAGMCAWVRAFTGDDLVVHRVAHARGGLLASAQTTSGVPVTVVTAWTSSHRSRARLELLGPTRHTVEIDAAVVRHSQCDAAGSLRHPREWETPERATLRRVIAACEGASGGRDLAELRADRNAVRRMLDGA